MKRFQSLLTPRSMAIVSALAKNEFSLMEQGTLLGFTLAFVNNVITLLIFHALFVNRFLADVPSPTVYLLLGIVQWNLYMNVAMAGFACFIYRQKILMGYAFQRELLILARTAAVFIPYLLELTLIILVAMYYGHFPREKYLLIPVLIGCEFLFCAGLCCIFAFIGVLHKNIIPFWNIMFRFLSFATPIFYLPIHFQSKWAEILYSWNPFTIYMLWIRDIVDANGFAIPFSPVKILLGSALVFVFGYVLLRKVEYKIGDHL